jgi:hypothetical protein
LNKSVESIADEVRTVSAAMQAEKQNTLSEFQKVNLAVSHIEAKITWASYTNSISCLHHPTPHFACQG